MKYYFVVFISYLIVSCSGASSEVTSQSKTLQSRKLPFIGHVDILEYKENGQLIKDTLYETISDFDFLNQDSSLVSNATYQGKICVAEFFFASCPTICPIMNTQMTNLHHWLEQKKYLPYFQLLSFSIDPENDSPSILNAYKKRYCDDCMNWDFLTGDENKTHELGIESFKIFAGKDKEAAGGYAHSGAFSLVDKSKRVRGVYNITDSNGDLNKNEFDRLKKDIVKLMQYEYNVK